MSILCGMCLGQLFVWVWAKLVCSSPLNMFVWPTSPWFRIYQHMLMALTVCMPPWNNSTKIRPGQLVLFELRAGVVPWCSVQVNMIYWSNFWSLGLGFHFQTDSNYWISFWACSKGPVKVSRLIWGSTAAPSPASILLDTNFERFSPSSWNWNILLKHALRSEW